MNRRWTRPYFYNAPATALCAVRTDPGCCPWRRAKLTSLQTTTGSASFPVGPHPPGCRTQEEPVSRRSSECPASGQSLAPPSPDTACGGATWWRFLEQNAVLFVFPCSIDPMRLGSRAATSGGCTVRSSRSPRCSPAADRLRRCGCVSPSRNVGSLLTCLGVCSPFVATCCHDAGSSCCPQYVVFVVVLLSLASVLSVGISALAGVVAEVIARGSLWRVRRAVSNLLWILYTSLSTPSLTLIL